MPMPCVLRCWVNPTAPKPNRAKNNQETQPHSIGTQPRLNVYFAVIVDEAVSTHILRCDMQFDSAFIPTCNIHLLPVQFTLLAQLLL